MSYYYQRSPFSSSEVHRCTPLKVLDQRYCFHTTGEPGKCEPGKQNTEQFGFLHFPTANVRFGKNARLFDEKHHKTWSNTSHQVKSNYISVPRLLQEINC